MSLGANRDYKTQDRVARGALAWHYARMNELIAQQGMTRLAASEQAYDELRKRGSERRQRRAR